MRSLGWVRCRYGPPGNRGLALARGLGRRTRRYAARRRLAFPGVAKAPQVILAPSQAEAVELRNRLSCERFAPPRVQPFSEEFPRDLTGRHLNPVE